MSDPLLSDSDALSAVDLILDSAKNPHHDISDNSRADDMAANSAEVFNGYGCEPITKSESLEGTYGAREVRSRKPPTSMKNYVTGDEALNLIKQSSYERVKKKTAKPAPKSLPSKKPLQPPAKTLPSRPVKVSDVKIKGFLNLSSSASDKFRKEQEQRLIETTKQLIQRQQPLPEKKLPEGQFSVSSLESAAERGVSESSSFLIGLKTPQTKRIGQRCKVYWDGDATWYYARILNYDFKHDKYFIYYELDNTVEWIRLLEETVLIAEGIRLAKYGAQYYPCIIFWSSPKAKELIKSLKGYKKGCEYIEYFDPENSGEYAFVSDSALAPLSDWDIHASKRGSISKKAETSMECARVEQLCIDDLIESVLRHVKKLAFLQLKGDAWIGIRVRASTHKLNVESSSSNIPGDYISAKCVGTIAKYCPNYDKYFVVFDQNLLQPQWVSCAPDSIEILISREDTDSSTCEAFLRSQGSIDKEDCSLCGLGKTDQESLPNQVTWLRKCSCCQCSYHVYCLPDASNEVFGSRWKCWNCLKCDTCSKPVWDVPLMSWNMCHATSLINRSVNVCGSCLNCYVITKDFCPICGEIYTSTAEAAQMESLQKDSIENFTESANSLTEVNMKNADMMVQCNECDRWVHSLCDGIDKGQYDAITQGTHPVWGDEYLCPECRVTISVSVIDQLRDLDFTQTFALPVTEALAKNYFEIIRNPMDLSTMRNKAERGQYKSLQSLRQDFELMCLNALVFNKTGDEYWIEAYQYHQRVLDTVFNVMSRATTTTAYGTEIQQILDSNTQYLKGKSQAKVNNRRRREEDTNEAPESRSTKQRIVEEELSESKKDGSSCFESEIYCQPVKDQTTRTPITSPAWRAAEKDDIMSPVKLDFEIPTELTPCGTSSCISCAAVTLTLDAAFLESFIDVCLICGSSDAQAFMLFCIDCGEAFHSFCADTPLAAMSNEQRRKFRCSNCKVCEICGDNTEEDGNAMLYCDSCDDTFHIACITPTLRTVPTNSQWFCPKCVICKEQHSRNKILHGWGFLKDHCYLCHSTYDERLKQNSPLVKKLASNPVLDSQATVDPVFSSQCGICAKGFETSKSYLQCSRCCKYIHSTCCEEENRSFLWTKESMAKDWSCRICLAEISVAAMSSHLGITSPKVMSVLSKVSDLQRKRVNHYRTIRQLAFSAFDKLMKVKWIKERKLMIGVCNWAARRALRISNNFTQDILASNPANSLGLWSRNRTQRFVAMLRLQAAKLAAKQKTSKTMPQLLTDYVTKIIEEQSKAHKSNSNRCGINSLGCRASMAAAFIRHTEHLQIPDIDLEAEVSSLKDETVSSSDIKQTYQLLLMQPIGLRDAPLPDKFHIGAASSQSDGTITNLNPLPGLKDSYLPHWAPGGYNKWTIPAQAPVSQNPRFFKSVPKKQHFAAQPSPQISIESTTQPRFEQTRVSENSLAPQPIPSIAKLHSVNLGSTGFGYYSKKLKQHVSPSELSAYTTARPSYPAPDGHKRMAAVMIQAFKQATERKLDVTVSSTEPLNVHSSTPLLTTGKDSTQVSLALLELATSSLSTVNAKPEPVVPEPIGLDIGIKIENALDVPKKADIAPKKRKFEKLEPNQLFDTNREATSCGIVPMRGWKIQAPELLVTDIKPEFKENSIDGVDSILEEATTRSIVSANNVSNTANAFSTLKWFEHRICCLCKTPCGPAQATLGRLLTFSDGWAAHANCLRWSFDVYEKSNTLVNALKARDRGIKTKCWYCDERGASINCRCCKRVFHFPCALAFNCTFIEAKQHEHSESSPHPIYAMMLCPEHVHTLESFRLSKDPFQFHCNPCEPIRPLFVDSHYNAEAVELAEYMSQKRSDLAVRTGSAVVHCMGTVCIDLPGFSTANYIYPYKFCCSRIYWSVSRPWQRACYVFDILKDCDVVESSSAADASSHGFHAPRNKVDDLIEETRQAFSITAERLKMFIAQGVDLTKPRSQAGLGERPLFRVKWVHGELESDDNSQEIMYSRSVDELYCMIISRVLDWREKELPSLTTRKKLGSYGLDAHQFFCIGLPFVRHAIERLPESVASMMGSKFVNSSFNVEEELHERGIRYMPSYHLPSKEAVARIKLFLQSQRSHTDRRTQTGCFRADPIISKQKLKQRKFNKTLAKAVTDEGEDGTAKTNDFADPGEDTDKLDSERTLSYKYQILSSAYLKNPNASLLVRKSSIHGYGLFAKQSFNKNDMIVEYIGQKIRQTVADRREVMYEEEGVGSCYLFRQGKDAIIDATRIGGMARFINHCCEPNAYAKVITAKKVRDFDVQEDSDESEDNHIVIMAARDIAAGEEVTYDYKFPIEDNKLPCFCNATKCLGFMN